MWPNGWGFELPNTRVKLVKMVLLAPLRFGGYSGNVGGWRETKPPGIGSPGFLQ